MAKSEPAKEKPEAPKPKPEAETKAAERECFFITPIGDPLTDERRECDGLLNAVLKPVFEAAGFSRVIVAHEINSEGSITQQVLEHVLSADVVVANLTHLNANVLYELAVRHCTYKPTICVARDGTKLPFDLLEDRVIFFRNDFSGQIKLRDDLSSRLEGIRTEKRSDNPVTRAKRSFSDIRLLEDISPKEFDVREELASIRELIRSLANERKRATTPAAMLLRHALRERNRMEFVGPSTSTALAFALGLRDIGFPCSATTSDHGTVVVTHDADSLAAYERQASAIEEFAERCDMKRVD